MEAERYFNIDKAEGSLIPFIYTYSHNKVKVR